MDIALVDGMPRARSRVVTYHIFGKRNSEGRRRFGTVVCLYEHEPLTVRGLLEALRLHDPSAPRRLGAKQMLVLQTPRTSISCRSDESLRVALDTIARREEKREYDVCVYFCTIDA